VCPADVLDQQREVSNFTKENVIQHLLHSYAKDKLSQSNACSMTLRTDLLGLKWTATNHICVPDFANLCLKCFASVHIHPFSRHHGGARWCENTRPHCYTTGLTNLRKYIVGWIHGSIPAHGTGQCCDMCQRVTTERQRSYGKLHCLSSPDTRWESVSVDLLTDLPVTASGHDAIGVFVD
jgi:hypothetical protein